MCRMCIVIPMLRRTEDLIRNTFEVICELNSLYKIVSNSQIIIVFKSPQSPHTQHIYSWPSLIRVSRILILKPSTRSHHPHSFSGRRFQPSFGPIHMDVCLIIYYIISNFNGIPFFFYKKFY